MLKTLYARLVLRLIRPALALQASKDSMANDLGWGIRCQVAARLQRKESERSQKIY